MEKIIRSSPATLAAYDLWLRAQHLLVSWDLSLDDEAESLLLRALEADPHLARAHSSLALQLNARPLLFPGYPNEREDRRKALHHARLAVECDPHDPRSHLAMMWVSIWGCDRSRAARHMQIAHELNPHSADVLIHVALVKAALGDARAAIALAREAIDLNPFHPDWYLYMISSIYVLAEEFDLALDSGLGIAHQFLELPGWLAIAAALRGDKETAARMRGLLGQRLLEAWKGNEPPSGRDETEWFISVNRWLEGRERDMMLSGLTLCGMI